MAGRKPIGKKAMTNAERQARHRAKISACGPGESYVEGFDNVPTLDDLLRSVNPTMRANVDDSQCNPQVENSPRNFW
jgi:hypothetical protein